MKPHEEKEILTFVKHFSTSGVHNTFTSSNSKEFMRNNQLFYVGLTGKAALFPLFKMATFYCLTPSQTEELWYFDEVWPNTNKMLVSHFRKPSSVFLEILQKYYQLPILGTLNMYDHSHQQ